jgi:hypothetical protein
MQTLGKSIIKAVAGVILYPYLTSSVGDATGRNTAVGRWNARLCLDRPVFVLSLDFLRNQCEFFVWIENFKTQILKY